MYTCLLPFGPLQYDSIHDYRMTNYSVRVYRKTNYGIQRRERGNEKTTLGGGLSSQPPKRLGWYVKVVC